MNEPRRLRDEGSELERALIASASSDAPSPRARAAAARALGIDPTPGGSGGGPSGGSAAATHATMSGAKIAGFVGLAAALALAAWQLVVLGDDEVETEHATVEVGPPPPAAEPPPAPPAAPIERTGERPPGGALDEAPREVQASPRSRPIARTRPVVEADVPEPAESVAPSTLAAEVAALDAARSAIRSGQTARALVLLDEYDARFARPELGPESDIARIEAHLASGDRAAARSLADRFLAAHPTSPAAARIRRLVPESSGESTLPER